MHSDQLTATPTDIPARLCEALPTIPEQEFWDDLTEQAEAIAAEEPQLRPLLNDVILYQPDFTHALATRLARKMAREDMTFPELVPLLTDVMKSSSHLICAARADILAINDRDAACHSTLQPLLYFKGFMALTSYRVAHTLWKQGRKQLAFYFQSITSDLFAADIHPAARIGCGILLDHATSFVVGETAIIEDEVSILHEVTLGGTGKQTGSRHPIVRSHVMIGAGAKILGRVEIGEGAKVGAGSVVLADVPEHVTVAGVPATIVGRSAQSNPADVMDQTLSCSGDRAEMQSLTSSML